MKQRYAILTLASVLVLLTSNMLPSVQANSLDGDYFGAYPDTGSKRDATYVYTTCDFGTTSSSITKDTYCLTSSAGQNSSGIVTPFAYQNYVMYNDTDNHLDFESEVWYISSEPDTPQAYDCETTHGCSDLGTASGTDYVKTLMYWISGKVKFYWEKHPTSGSVTADFNPDYTPISGGDTTDHSTKFASGSDSIGGTTFKFTQWGVGSPHTGASNWNIEQKEMSTWYPSTSSPFSSDTAKTTDPAGGASNGSHITGRTVGGTTYTLKIGAQSYCVHRNNNVAGDIQWQDGGTCLGYVQLWP